MKQKKQKKHKKLLPDWPNEIYLIRNKDCASGFEALSSEEEFKDIVEHGQEVSTYQYDVTQVAELQYALLPVKDAASAFPKAKEKKKKALARKLLS